MAIKIGTKADKDHYSGRCKRGYIEEYKTEDIEVKNGLWTKIDNDPSLIILWSVWLAFRENYRVGPAKLIDNIDLLPT